MFWMFPTLLWSEHQFPTSRVWRLSPSALSLRWSPVLEPTPPPPDGFFWFFDYGRFVLLCSAFCIGQLWNFFFSESLFFGSSGLPFFRLRRFQLCPSCDCTTLDTSSFPSWRPQEFSWFSAFVTLGDVFFSLWFQTFLSCFLTPRLPRCPSPILFRFRVPNGVPLLRTFLIAGSPHRSATCKYSFFLVTGGGVLIFYPPVFGPPSNPFSFCLLPPPRLSFFFPFCKFPFTFHAGPPRTFTSNTPSP